MNLGNFFVSLLAGVAGAFLFVGVADHQGYIQLSGPNEATTTSQNGDLPAISTGHEQAVISAVEKANPAVVSIVLTQDVPVIERYFEDAPSGFNPFEEFFGESPFQFQIPQYRQNGTEEREVGGGSGFLISEDGMIVTNRHVVSSEDVTYTVFTNDGERHEATVVARDPAQDLAIVKIEGNNFPHLELADSEQLRVGQTVIAIGNALSEFQNTVSEGIVSGLARNVVAGDGRGEVEALEGVIQTDAAINPGNSGGPLIDLAGRVVGVNVAVALGSENIGFALPSNLVQSVVSSVEEHGRVIRPFIGVRYVPITASLRERNNLSVDHGVLVSRGETAEELAVIPGSPADKAGIVENDIILEADGKRLDENTSLASVIRTKNVGDTIELKVLHQGQERTVTVTLEESPQ